MAQRAASADQTTTRQYAGHVKHMEHLAEQETMRQERRKARLKAKRDAKRESWIAATANKLMEAAKSDAKRGGN